jgi:hypothetical protein
MFRLLWLWFLLIDYPGAASVFDQQAAEKPSLQ